MEKVKEIKRVQVNGKRYLTPAEDAEIEKLIQNGLAIKKKMDDLKDGLEKIHDRLIEIARYRREGTTTVILEGISVQALITFRESYQVKDKIDDIRQPLGVLFERFFEKKIEYKTTADFKKFMESEHALGIINPEKVKAAIIKYVSVKETKPNVRMESKDG